MLASSSSSSFGENYLKPVLLPMPASSDDVYLSYQPVTRLNRNVTNLQCDLTDGMLRITSEDSSINNCDLNMLNSIGSCRGLSEVVIKRSKTKQKLMENVKSNTKKSTKNVASDVSRSVPAEFRRTGESNSNQDKNVARGSCTLKIDINGPVDVANRRPDLASDGHSTLLTEEASTPKKVVALKRTIVCRIVTEKKTCEYCGKICKDGRSWRSHIRWHTGEKPYSCDTCEQRFADKPGLIRHMLKHSGGSKPAKKVCEICGLTSDKFGNYRNHMRTYHRGAKPCTCEICSRRFSNSANLRRHMLGHTGVKPHLCQHCGKSFIQKVTLTDHIAAKHVPCQSYHCKKCDGIFPTRNQYQKHYRRCYPESSDLAASVVNHLCYICGKNLSTRTSLWSHMLLHEQTAYFSCFVCDRSFMELDQLKRHTLVDHNKVYDVSLNPFQCEICGETSACAGTFSRHMYIQHGDKPFKCVVCSKSFSQKPGLDEHKRLHINKKYKCPTCDKTFARKQYAEEHIRLHDVSNVILCIVCRKSFANKQSLELHQRCHDGVKPYQCSVCKRNFRQPPHLKTHMLTHSDVKPFACAMCNKAYKNFVDLRLHRSRVHGTDDKVSSSYANRTRKHGKGTPKCESTSSREHLEMELPTDNN